jgi:hypothetical protein
MVKRTGGPDSGKTGKPKRKKGKLASLSRDRRRRIYLTHRLPEVVGDLEKLASETETLSVRLNDTALAQGSAERMSAEERLVYLRERRPALMKELESLKKEHTKFAKERE